MLMQTVPVGEIVHQVRAWRDEQLDARGAGLRTTEVAAVADVLTAIGLAPNAISLAMPEYEELGLLRLSGADAQPCAYCGRPASNVVATRRGHVLACIEHGVVAAAAGLEVIG